MTNNQLPVALQSKLGRNYEIEIDGAKVKASVINDYRVLCWKIDGLKSLLQTSRSRVVGLDVKTVQDLDKKSFVVQMLVLSVGTRCLIIQFRHTKYDSDTLIKFLVDDTICFVSTGIEDEVNFVLHDRHNLECRTGIKVGHFASRVLKKANIVKYGLAELAGEVGMDIKEPIGERPDRSARFFSPEQIKYAVHNAYTTYVIGNKLVEISKSVDLTAFYDT